MVNETLSKLRLLGLHGMAQAVEEQMRIPEMASLTFDERLAQCVDRELLGRANRRTERRLRDAQLKEKALIEDLDWHPRRKLDKGVILALASCNWIRHHQNVICVGPTGAGKTYLACALAHRACSEGLTSRFYRLPRLFSDLAVARLDGSYPKFMARLAKTDLLILDDWGQPLTDTERRELMEVIEDRTEKSTIITTQLPIDKWHQVIGDPSLADSILDRLVHRAHKIDIDGPSLRKKKGLKAKELNLESELR